MTLFASIAAKSNGKAAVAGRQTTNLFNALYTKLYPEFMCWKKRE
jgi:hypothetical protein